MRFEMDCSLILTDEVDRDLIEEALESAEGLLQKGVPEGEEGARITKWRLMGNRVEVNLVSGRYVRCHEAILRIRKHLSGHLGKKAKVGVRGVEVERYEIWYGVEDEPRGRMKLPFTEKLEIRDGEAHLVLKDLDEEALEKKYVDRLLKRLEEKIREQHITGKAGYLETVRKSKKRLERYAVREDPTEELLKRNWVKRAGRGVWTVLPPYAALWRAIERLVMDRIAAPLGFQEVLLPKIVPLDVQEKKGQLSGIPNEIWWVCPPKTRDPKAWEGYRDYVKITGRKAPELLAMNLGRPEFALSYAQCEPFYDLWSGGVMDREKLPVKFVDNYGPTWRYESGGLKGLERMNEFKRMEFVWISSPEDAIGIRDSVLDATVGFIDRIFDVEWRVDATTAVYLEHAGEKEENGEMPYVRTYDLTVSLPFETLSRPERELEIASFHVHEDFYAKSFNWKEKKGRELWSGCVGISPTRFAYVFLLRYGFDYKAWPKEVKGYIGNDLPMMPENLFV